jgi:amino acid adenylation domain-containing protein
MFAWQNTKQELFKLPGLEVHTIPPKSVKSKFDLLLDLRETGGTISGIIEYSTSLFEQTTIDRYVRYLRKLLEGMIADDYVAVDRLPIMPETETQQVVYDWNATRTEYDAGVSLAEAIEDRVARTPDAIAVTDENRQLTYSELNSLANRLSVELRSCGAGPDEVVGLCVERSVGMVVSLLAIVKSGAAYLPLDPWFPPERLTYMLEDSGARLLIVEQRTRELSRVFSGTTILLENESWLANSANNPAVTIDPEHLAYLIYTSGSTGKPKGVQIPRKALSNFLFSMRDWLQPNERDRLLAVTTISFDIAGLEIWLPLLAGAQIVMASREDAADGNALRALIERHDITFLQATPVTWWLLLGAGWIGKPNMQAICGGEAMPHELAKQLAPMLKRFWNLYGPTETTIWSTGYLIEDGSPPVPIGRPIGNTQCFILDSQRQPVPIGTIGELYIAGDGLARGYLNRPELTEERFVSNPFCPERDAKMFRTGDLARYLPNGVIQCLGRTDRQVKLRGFRIELGEIEAALKQHSGIRQATVAARGVTASEKKLVAYFIPSCEPAPESAELRAFLRRNLPDYMVPSEYLALESFPISPNGKIDIEALPDPSESAVINPELGPIESLLRKYQEFDSVALILRPNAEPDERPVVFAVAKNGQETPLVMLRKYLRGRCPEKFIPGKIVYLRELPSSRAGAIDRASLMKMEWGAAAGAETQDNPDSPRTETEIKLAEIWREILKIPQAGVSDKFFDIGGHSLLSIQMISRVERETGYRFSLREILMNTLGQLAQKLSESLK